jgi:hypothetical protein
LLHRAFEGLSQELKKSEHYNLTEELQGFLKIMDNDNDGAMMNFV